jgi:diguanylate cyclase (GGDEF)-like protein
MTLALSFSLAQTLRHGNSTTQAVEWCWRRVLVASCAARLIGNRLQRKDSEELALAALLQDIGILALRAALPDEYEPVLEQARDHEELVRLERERLGTDHGEAGSWLMAHWKLPEKLVSVPVCVHGRSPETAQADHATFFDVVEIAGTIADLILGDDAGGKTEVLLRSARKIERLNPELLQSLLDEIGERLPEISELYDTEIISPELLSGIIDQARQVMADRQLMAGRESHLYDLGVAGELGDSAERNDDLQDDSDRQSSEMLDARLDLEFRRATTLGHPLALAFVCLDDYEQLIARHGRNAADAVLQTLQRSLARLAGRDQLVFSSAEDEFVALLPGISRTRAHEQLERLRVWIGAEDFLDSDEQPFEVTISIGLACHMDESQLYDRAIELLGAADQALRGPAGSAGNTLTMAC